MTLNELIQELEFTKACLGSGDVEVCIKVKKDNESKDSEPSVFYIPNEKKVYIL